MPAPVITVAQMREWEKVSWASGQVEQAVMRQAGRCVARRAEQLTRPGELILVLAGKGHNGDDAAFAAEYISEREVRLIRVADPEAASKEINEVLDRRPALIVDGLFGIGLNRSLSERWIQLIQQVNNARLPMLSVDVPSGLNADTGMPLDDAIRATCTLTLGAAKAGMLSATSWPFIGRLEVAPEIGLVPYPFTTEISVLLPEDFAGFPPPRPITGHKGTFGHLVIIAGSLGYHGAAVLAARGAQRAQPGLITLITEHRVYEPVAQQLQSVMVHPWAPKTALPLPESATAILFGPGLASPYLHDSVKRTCQELWQESELPVIADASALEWLPQGPCLENTIRIITPHPGEAARMLKTTPGEIQSNRLQALRSLSGHYGDCAVVLKGHHSLIGSRQDDLFVNCSGNPHLAQGGSGDLLAGYLGGLLAQPELQKDPVRTICYAVWQHGAAADLLQAQHPNWTIEDLAAKIGSVPPTANAGWA